MKTGEQHIKSLKDGRAIYIDGRPVADVTRHPAFRAMVKTAGGFYDMLRGPEAEKLSMVSPASGERVWRHWDLPRDHASFVARRKAMEAMAEATCGWVGRSPDHVPSTLVGMMMGHRYMADFDARGAAALADYFAYARDRDLYLTYVIINPQADKAKTASGQPSEDLVARIVDEDSGGLTISGAKMLATSAIVANEILISGIQPLQPGDEAYAFTAAIPVATKGLKFLSRRSYEAAATSPFDYPLATRFDENDAVAVFDDVKIPWDRVFLHRNLAGAFGQWHETRAHVMQNHQCLVRLYVKLRFLVGLARRIAETNGIIGFPAVKEKLGALAARATMIEAMVAGMEAAGETYEGYFVPDRPMLCAAQAIAQETYPAIIHMLRDLAGGGMTMLPSSADDLSAPEVRAMIERTQKSPTLSSLDRVKFFKLAWDAVGSEFGSRHLQYEMFYSGSSVVLNGHNFRNFDWGRAGGMVDDFLTTYDTPAPARPAASA